MHFALLLLLLAIAPMSPGLSQDEEAAWGEAASRHTSESYQEYIERFPTGEHVEEAFRRMLDRMMERPSSAALEDRTLELLNYSRFLYDRAEDGLWGTRDRPLLVSRDSLLKVIRILHVPSVDAVSDDPIADEHAPGSLVNDGAAGASPERKEVVLLLKQARELLEPVEEDEIGEAAGEVATVPSVHRSRFMSSSFQCLDDKKACEEHYGWLDCELIMLVCVLERIVPFN